MAYVFSYGTLQKPDIQWSLFQRELAGNPDCLTGYRLSHQKIYGEYPVIEEADPSESLTGMNYELTEQELRKADTYEGEGYQRTLLQLESGKKAWVYTAKTL